MTLGDENFKNRRTIEVGPVAVLVDGGFFIKRYRNVIKGGFNHSPRTIAEKMLKMAMGHAHGKELYRVIYYDCIPFDGKKLNPISKRTVNFSRSRQAVFQNEFHQELKKLRKVALRLSDLRDGGAWLIKPEKMRLLLQKKITLEDLTDGDVSYNLQQKGVDIKIGVDIASIAFKKQARQIVLISGDSDFVPAAKLARREGIDFILDQMWNAVSPSLFEHIDGLRTETPHPTWLNKQNS